MYQEEILKAIKEQTEAIDRQTQAIKKQTQAFEQFAENFVHIFGPGIEKEWVKIEDMTPEQREENRKRIFAELNAALASKRK
jgi:DNA-directed RNA polymerase subunit F